LFIEIDEKITSIITTMLIILIIFIMMTRIKIINVNDIFLP